MTDGKVGKCLPCSVASPHAAQLCLCVHVAAPRAIVAQISIRKDSSVPQQGGGGGWNSPQHKPLGQDASDAVSAS